MQKIICVLVILFVFNNAYTQTISGTLSFCQNGSTVLTVINAPAGASFLWQRSTDGGVTWVNATPAGTGISYTVVTAAGYRVLVNGVPIAPVTVTVNANPVSAFTFSPTGQCSNTPVAFVNNSTGSSLSYAWNFGDIASGAVENTSIATRPIHTFIGSTGINTQNFSVSLTSTDINGCKSVYSSTVTTRRLPDTTLGGTGLTSYNGMTYFTYCTAGVANFTFTNKSTTASSDTHYRVVFGDSSPDYDAAGFTSTSHVYSAGTYNLQFIVTGSGGCIDTGRYYVFVGTNPAVTYGARGNTSICTGSPLTFDIGGIGLNPSSTVYTLTFNDKTPDIVYNHLAPDSITHVFATTSCGINVPGYTNSFSATIVASNACKTSTVIVVPIYVSQKAAASFTISPNDTACVNSVVKFTNTSVLGNNASVNNCGSASSVWSISPSSGWSISSGSLGNEFSSSDPGVWTNGSTILNINFTVAGKYTIKLKSGANALCGSDSTVKTICVNPAPAGTLQISTPGTGCAPLTVSATTGITSAALCGSYRVSWGVSYTPATGCVPTTGTYTYVNGTNSFSLQPVFQFSDPGSYVIRDTIYSPGNSCYTVLSSTPITVKGNPNIKWTVPSTICQTTAINPTTTATCNAGSTFSYAWLFPGSLSPTSTLQSPANILFNTAGTYNISLAVTNECGTTNVTQPITVKDLPASPAAASNSPLCSGSTLNLTVGTAPAGTTYLWTGPGGYTSTSQNPVRTNTTAAMSGTYSVAATLNGCTSPPSTVNIVISQVPTTPAVITPVNYCQGTAAIPLTATVSAGNTLNWYTAATGGTASTTAPTPVTTVAGTLTYYVSQFNPTAPACESGRASIIVNVRTVPAITGSSADPTSCSSSNGTITLTGSLPSASYSVDYTKNAGTPTTLTLASNGSGAVIITNLSSGSYTNVTVTANGCTSNTVGPFILVSPSAPATPSAGSNSPLCAGSTLNLTSGTVPAGATYVWTGPGGFTSALQNPVIPNITTAMSGAYSVTAIVNGCSSAPAIINVAISPAAVVPGIVSPLNYCQNASALPLTATAATGYTLNWYTAANGGAASTSAPTPATTTAGTTVYYVSQFSSTAIACESGRAAITVNVQPVPVIAGSFTDPVGCSSSNGLITVTGLTPAASYSVEYSRNSGTPTTVTLAANINGAIAITNLSPGTYSNIVVTANGCASNAVGPFTLVSPSAPATPTATSNSPLCAGSTLNLTAGATTAGATYSWTGPDGFTSSQQNPVRTNVTTAMSGSYSVTATVNGCTSAPVTVNAVIESPGIITAGSNGSLCAGSALMLTSNTTSPGVVNYTWSGPNGFSSNVQNPTIQNATTAASGVYTVTVTSLQGNCFSSANTNVLVTPAPVITTANYTDPVTCTSLTGKIVLNGLTPNMSYLVQYSRNGSAAVTSTIRSDANGSIPISNLSGGTYTNISVTLGSCTSNVVGPFTLVETNSAPARPKATSNSPLCVGTVLMLGASTISSGNITYQWSGPNGFTSGSQNPIISNITTAAGGRYYVMVNSSNCVSEKDSVDVSIGDYPIVNLGPDLTLASGVQHPMTSSIQNGPIIQYVWTPSTNLSCTNCLLPVANVQSNISYILKVTNSYGCSSGDTINIKTMCEKSNVFIPDAFTPDGDGLNDVFMIRGSGPVRVQYLRIFNKWGEMIFEKMNFLPNDSKYGWDGRIKGVIGPTDVFVYIASVTCDNGSVFTYKGNVTILK